MSNHIATSKQVHNLNTNLFMARQLCTEVILSQEEESKFSVELLTEDSVKALLFLKGLNIQILGKETFTFAGMPHECLKVKIEFTVEEDWELEEVVFYHFKKYGYRTPTQIILGQAT